MELNELRQMWNRQATYEPAPLSPQHVAHLVAGKSASVITRMRRNAWWEVGSVVYMIIALPFGISYFDNQFIKGYLLVFELLSVAFLYYYYRKLKLLRQMDQIEHDVRGHLQTLILGLRGLLALYMRLSLWLTLVALVAVTAYHTYQFILNYDGATLLVGLGGLLLIMAFAGIVAYRLVFQFTTWYLHKLYGQHLDRLEGYLQELQAE
jgi:hypothetical protein